MVLYILKIYLLNKKLRCSLPKDYKQDYFDVNEKNFIPCIGNFGTTIFFVFPVLILVKLLEYY